MRETRDKPQYHGITARSEHNRNFSGGIFGSLHRRRRKSENCIDFETHEIVGELRQSFDTSFGNSIFDQNILALDISKITQCLAKYVAPRQIRSEERRVGKEC